MPEQLQRPHRFETLDALRGIAALLVVQLHMPFLFLPEGRLPFPHAYLAVDFFFMLSGFVLSFAYGDRLRAGWATGSFLKERWIRLYPLFLLSIPFGVLHLVVTTHRDRLPLPARELPWVLLFTVFVLPLPKWFITGGYNAYPVNGPSWSLFLEAVANILHATVLRRRTAAQIIGIAVFCNLLLLKLSLSFRGVEVGFLKGQLWLGIVRVSASYTFGMVLFQFWKRERLRRSSFTLLSAGLLILVLVSPLPRHGNALFDLLAIWLVFPLVILTGAYSTFSEHFGWPLRTLGVASYAIYVLHPAVFTVFTAVWTGVSHTKPSDHVPISGFVFIPMLVAVSLLADRYWDVPARRFLKRKLSSVRS